MREFFYPSSMAVFGVGTQPGNLAKNIVLHCREMGFQGRILPVGRKPGIVHGIDICTDPGSLPNGLDLAVILVPAAFVAETLEICGRKGIRHAIISTGGFREFEGGQSQAENEILEVTERFGIRFIGPNSIGVICTDSGLCSPFNPMQVKHYKRGTTSLIIQSGGVTTQCAYSFSDEHVGFSKIVSVGNKLNVGEIDLIEYFNQDDDTKQIHLYLESIEEGPELIRVASKSDKPVVVFKANVSTTASKIAMSHTAALFNDDRVVDGAFRQSGILRVGSIHDMTVCAKVLRLPPLRGNRLVAISMSGGFSVILGDMCEKLGFECPDLPRELLDQIESYRRGGVIRMSNPMDFGDVHDVRGLVFALEQCLALDSIDGIVLCHMYEPEMMRMLRGGIGSPEQILTFFEQLCSSVGKPIALSFFGRREKVEELQRTGVFPVFNDPMESVRAMGMLLEHGRRA
jgi:acyl-CoA synthetase (NDP forming)